MGLQAHQKYSEMATYKDELSRTFYGQVERMHVLNKAGEFFQFESTASQVRCGAVRGGAVRGGAGRGGGL